MALDFTDIIDSVKTRFSNPFFGTYAVTFLFVNWHIPVGLLMLSKEDVIELGYGNWVAFIDYHLSFSKGVAIPLSLLEKTESSYPKTRSIQNHVSSC